MDALLLEAVVGEAAARLVEREILRVSSLGSSRYLLRFVSTSRDQLLISVRPDLPRLHLIEAQRRIREEAPDRFAAFLDQELGGAVLASIVRRPWDRVVTLAFRLPAPAGQTGQRAELHLVAELTGRSANLFLLDREGTIRSSAREPRGRLPGEAYAPPPGREAYAGLTVDPSSMDAIRRRFEDPAAFLETLGHDLARGLPRGEPGWARIEEILRAAAGKSWSPTIYSTRPLEDLTVSERLGRDDLILSPLPLPLRGRGPAASGLIATPFDTCSAACEAGFGLIERSRDFLDRREHHVALVRREIERLEKLIGKLETDGERAAQADHHRRQAEALLAGLSAASVVDGMARVPDPYGEEGTTLLVPIDPARSLPDNARALFDRFKKGKRAAKAVAARLSAARDRLAQWRPLLTQAENMREEGDLDSLRQAMDRLGLVHAARRQSRADRPAADDAAPARLRRHVSPDGMVILIGKSGQENDTLTFKIAAPWDFWLHAAPWPGAHVVVRNPQRLKEIPAATLRAAAGIAAFYSGGRSEARVEVHYTQRKHIHKRRGAPSGQVLVRRHRSIDVAPSLPASTLEDL